MQLDPNTLYATLLLFCFVIGVAQLVAYATRMRERWLAYWGVGNIAASLGLLLLVLRGTIPDVLSIAGGNTLLVASLCILWAGLRRFAHRPPLWGIKLPLVMTLLVTLALPSALNHDMAARVVLVGSALAMVLALMGLTTVSLARRERLTAAWLAAAMFLPAAAVNMVRALMALPQMTNETFDADGTLNTVYLLVTAAAVVGWNVAIILMASERLHRTLSRSASLDPLTQTLNRSAFRERAASLLRRARREQRPLALLLADLDSFKQINDGAGHAAGDEALRGFAETARAHLRAGDLLGRFGGDEFCILMPEADAAQARALAEQLRAAYAMSTRVWHDAGSTPTVSIGVAMMRPDTPTLDSLFLLADQALYRAKRDGRDRVSLHDSGGLIFAVAT